MEAAGMYGTPAMGPAQGVRNGLSPPPRWTRAPEPIPVSVRIVWEIDGEQWISGTATRWTSTQVYVEFDDTRKRTTGVWVVDSDVRRKQTVDHDRSR